MARKTTPDTKLRLIEEIYAAADDPSLWPAFLEHLSDVVKGQATVLISEDLRDRTASIGAAVRVDTAYQRDYEAHYAAKNPYFQTRAAEQLLQEGRVMPGQLSCSPQVLEKTEYYNDYLRKLDLFHTYAAVIERDGEVLSVVTSLRPRRMGPWDRELEPLFEVLLPHLRRALIWHRRLAQFDQERQSATDALDASGLAVVLIDANGKVLRVNPAAAAMLAERDGLELGRAGLLGATPEWTRKMRQLLHHATTRDCRDGGVLNVPRPSGRSPWHLFAIPLSSSTSYVHAAGGAPVALFVSESDRAPRIDKVILRELFALTSAEAALTAFLATGMSVESAAQMMRITVATARWHIRNILGKTGAARLSDLSRIILSSPATLTRRLSGPLGP